MKDDNIHVKNWIIWLLIIFFLAVFWYNLIKFLL